MLIDTHAHLDGEEFASDLADVVVRAKEAGIGKILVPNVSSETLPNVDEVCRKYSGYLYPMIGLHPENIGTKDENDSFIDMMRERLSAENPYVAIGEVGLDFYWSREFENEQLAAFEEQVRWSVETRLPLMIHCRKGQNEMVNMLRRYEGELPGGVFHCFTGNEREAAELLRFDNFMLGIGGVLTFKKSRLPETLAAAVPLSRIVLETDSPYMAPVPMRGKRNESAFTLYVLKRLAECYGVSEQEVADATNDNVRRVFGRL